MTSAKGGRPQKGKAITEGFNAKKSYRKIPNARQIRAELAAKKKKMALLETASKESAAALIQDDIDSWGSPPAFDTGEETERIDKPSAGEAGLEATPGHQKEEGEEEDDAFTEDLMKDMRWVYKQLRGRQRLKELMGNDKEFLILVKELMKLEAAYLTNKMKARGGGNAQGFLVVLKGLEGDNKLVADMKKDKTIDFKQIERTLNPVSDLLGPAEDDDHNEAPVQIIRKGLTVEQEEEMQEGVKLAEEEW